MKTTTLTLGDKNYEAALLTHADYKRAAGSFLQVKRAGELRDLTKAMDCLDTMVELLRGAIARAGVTISVEEISGAAPPAQIMETLNSLMLASATVALPDLKTN